MDCERRCNWLLASFCVAVAGVIVMIFATAFWVDGLEDRLDRLEQQIELSEGQ